MTPRSRARALLDRLGLDELAVGDGPHADEPDAQVWAASGAMALTGRTDGPACRVRAPVASAAAGAVLALAAVSGSDAITAIDGAALLGERAACAGLSRAGRTAPGGHCRLLRAADGWLAVSLARPEDVRALPAWLGEGEPGDPFDFVAQRLRGWGADAALERARLLALPVAPVAPPPAHPRAWFDLSSHGPTRRGPAPRNPLVVDLSTLWAGPLCAHLLGLAGARVIRIESVGRPDGARGGPAPFYDLLHAGQESVAVDPRTPDGLAALRGLLAVADVVVESARPRALAQLGIDAARWVRRRPGLVWVSLTGYGRTLPERSWVAFGDDAGAAAGLAFAVEAPDLPLLCGDAIADPLAGVHAALAASVFHQRGQSVLLDVSLCGVAKHVAAGALPLVGDTPDPDPPRARRASGSARVLGVDTEAVMREFPPCAGPEPSSW